MAKPGAVFECLCTGYVNVNQSISIDIFYTVVLLNVMYNFLNYFSSLFPYLFLLFSLICYKSVNILFTLS